MNKRFLCTALTLFFIFTTISANAEFHNYEKTHKPTYKEQKQFDKMLDERLQLSDEQKSQLKSLRSKHIKEMEKTVSKMEDLRKKIKNVYILGIPKYQADIRTAAYKTELALLKQDAMKQRAQHRKEFENILTKEQKAEFEKVKSEFPKHKHEYRKNNK